MITRCLSTFFILCCLSSSAQFREDFSESLTNPHLWEGSLSYFRINEAQQLQSNGPAASGKIFLQTYSNALTNASWTFGLRMTFESSASNYTKIFLASSSPDLLDPQLEAYYLKVGGLSGSKDGMDLYYQKGATEVLVAKGREGRAGGNPVTLKIKVTRDDQGNWQVYSDTLGGDDFQPESSGKHAAVFSSQAFGFLCVHSSTRRTNFYFDDLIIEGGFVDEEAPELLSPTVEADSAGWLLVFHEFLNPLSVPVFQQGEDSLTFRFYWKTPTALLLQDTAAYVGEGRAVDVILSGISDRAGNTKQQPLRLIRPKPLAQGDVVINEILFNPFSYGEDFIELYNRSPWFVSLKGSGIRNQTGEQVFLASLLMEPNAYRVLTKDSLAVRSFYALSATGTFVRCPLPMLPDDKGSVLLFNQKGDTIDRIHYTQSMHHPLLESEEGISLERVNSNDPAQWSQNWQSASVSSGGATPGYANSQTATGTSESLLHIEPRCIAPGTDGYRNYATIRYSLPKSGGSLRLDIFSLQGHWICSLQPSGPADARGICTWNGMDASLQPVSTGLYLVVAEFFHPDGDHLKVKDTISVLLR